MNATPLLTVPLALVLGSASLLGAPAIPGGENAPSESEDWASLDREIAELAANLNQPSSGFSVGGYLRINFASSDDLPVAPTNNDLSGFLFDNARMYFEGQTGDWGVYVQVEAGSGTLDLIDAFIHTDLNEYVTFTMGQFKRPLLWSGMLEPIHLLLIPYTTSGSIWSTRDLGAQANGSWERLRWWAAAHNGSDNAGDEFRYTGRVAVHLLGPDYATQRLIEGAYGAPQALNLVLGAGASDDDQISGGDAGAVDARLTWDQLYLHGEYVHQPDDPALGFLANASQWAATASYMIVPDQWEVALRWEELNDSVDRGGFIVGVNYYIEGHNVKWQLNYADIDADAPGNDTQVFSLGLTGGV